MSNVENKLRFIKKLRLPLWEFSPRVVLLGLFLAGLVLWKVPQWQVVGLLRDVSTNELDSVDERRRTLTQIIGGFGLLTGLYLTYRRISATEDGQITERFTKAIDQLGSEKLEVKLGGIYALERIARDSEKDHWTIMEVLTAFLRENARRKQSTVKTQADATAASSEAKEQREESEKKREKEEEIKKKKGLGEMADVAIGKGEEEKVFILSNRSEKELVSHLGGRSLLSVFGGVLLTIICTVLLLLKIGGAR